MEYQKPKGTVDILPGQSEIWEKIELNARETFHLYGYHGIRTPIFEDYNVFARNVGDTSDIVTKEMYDFNDKGNRHIALRPEGTAGTVRAYVENKLYGPEYSKPYKVYYMGPMFRYERPQSGRQRQFNQIGVEALNTESPQVDVEVISMAMNLFKKLGIKNIKLVINSLGDSESRDNYRKALINYLEPYFNELSEDSQSRLYKNPLRVLDSKDEKDQEIIKNAPSILDYLNEYSADYFEKVKELLTELNITFEVDYRMVRGLDYYTHTIFEIMSDSNAFGNKYTTVCAGGRYNGLISQLGGPDEGGIGFGMGVERLILLLNEENPDFITNNKIDLFLVSADSLGDNLAFIIVDKLRKKGIYAEKSYINSKVKTQIKEAIRKNAKYYAVIGKNECESKAIEIKESNKDNVEKVNIAELVQNPHDFLH
ncbi:histidine--tRNA ligase [Ligilactobacillus cholophilus]|uniref:histidine--tRNA ligase n=1 Tax=Ligilactobacillus cholophilus TaxID=3050131 RepID=UPI0025B0306B|nr:histidine--tRNA ligase [Ligilactobacillus cholophilus]